jgi:hypothetical protein
MSVLFPPKLVAYLIPKKATMFLLSCGAVISDPDSFKRLVLTTTL